MDMEMWKILFILVGAISLLHSSCYCEKAPKYTFMKPATLAPQVSYLDYIIIGGGTAGCALAATLSEGGQVLLLERGGAPYGNKIIEEMSGFGSNLGDGDDDHSLPSTAQQFVSEDGVVSARARVLGGGSAVNAGFYSRASQDYVAEVGWVGSLVNESYTWVEKKVAFKPPMLQFQSAFKDGLIEVGVKPYNGFTYDHKVGTKIGGTIFDHNGKRHTAANLLEYANPNTTVVYLFATVHKILFKTKGQYSQKPRAHGIIFRDSKGMKHKAYVKAGEMNEIILSAGALGSPQLLMLSGIGPKAHLNQHGIEVLVDQPMVGQGMSDNPMNAVIIPSPNPVEVSLIQAVGITKFGSYIEAASSATFANAIIHSVPAAYKEQEKDEKSQLFDQKAYEFINSVANETLYASLILEKITGPISKGHLLLKNKNPSDNPSVTFNYFKEKEDLTRCVQGMETIIKVIQSKSFSKFRYSDLSAEDLLTTMVTLPLNRCPRPSNDTGVFTTLEQYCKDTVMTIWHYHGGCQVYKVVDKDYRVYNVSGLRVVDGSTFYASPGTNPQATVMMLGRYMGRRILQSRNATSK